MSEISIDSFSCPLPIMDYDTVQLAHGAGGKLSAELIDKVFIPCFGNQILDKMEDQAVLERPAGRLAFTTDTFTVSPIFFPGGNIGELAINGTVNDVCMSGATPLYLSVGFIIEEGLPIEELHHIVVSMKAAAEKAGVRIVTGDTKVVNKGNCDKLFINTSGIGVIPDGLEINAKHIQSGDKILLSGTIADHGMAVMTVREGLSFQSTIESDTTALNGLVQTMLKAGQQVHAMRDPTRGGVATTLNEWAKASGLGIRISEDQLPVRNDVRGACEILGIDPMYVANEGKLLAVVAAEETDMVLEAMRNHPLGRDAVLLGEIVEEHSGKVTMINKLGVERIIDMPVGEQLPRIC